MAIFLSSLTNDKCANLSSPQINLAFIITGLGTGGAEVMLHKLIKNVDRSRFNLTVISLTTLDAIGERIGDLGVHVVALGMHAGLPNPVKLFHLFNILRQLKPDVVHTWMYHADLTGGLIARLVGCRRVIWGIRHSDLSIAHNKLSTLVVVRVCALLSGWLPTRILSCSQQAKAVHAKVGYPIAKIHVIPNGFDLSSFAPSAMARITLRNELGLAPETLLVGVVGRYNSQKNHLGFVHAASLVLAQLPNVHFILAGAGLDIENTELCTAIAAHSNLQAHIHLLGSRDDVPRLMAALDVLALPSHGEAFPNVLGEAMACGVPCAVTNVGDAAEIVGTSGRVVAIGDMDGLALQLLDFLCMSADARTALGQQARTRVQTEYEISHVARLYQAFYERVAAEL